MLLKLGWGVRVVATHLTPQHHTRVSRTETWWRQSWLVNFNSSLHLNGFRMARFRTMCLVLIQVVKMGISINSLGPRHITMLFVQSHQSNNNSLWCWKSIVTVMVWLTSGQGQLGKAWSRGVDLTARSWLANHVASDQMAVEDVPCGGDESTAMTHAIQCISVDLKVTLTVCFSGESWQTDETDEWTLTCGRTERDIKLTDSEPIYQRIYCKELVNEGTLDKYLQLRLQCSDPLSVWHTYKSFSHHCVCAYGSPVSWHLGSSCCTVERGRCVHWGRTPWVCLVVGMRLRPAASDGWRSST